MLISCAGMKPPPAIAVKAVTVKAMAGTLAEACARSVCRTDVKELRLRTLTRGTVVLMTERFPYADDGQVSVFAGEAVVVDFASSKMISDPHFVRVVDRIDETRGRPRRGGRPTLSFQLNQDPDKPSMKLLIKSTLNVPIKFDANIFVPTVGGTKWTQSFTCPVDAGSSGTETWPYPIGMVVLTNFRIQPGRSTCE